MLPEVKQKLDSLIADRRWSEVLIQHNQDGVSCVGIHEVFGYSDDVTDGTEGPDGVSWTEHPIIVADDLEDLKKYLLSLLELVERGQTTTEEELSLYNEEKD